MLSTIFHDVVSGVILCLGCAFIVCIIAVIICAGEPKSPPDDQYSDPDNSNCEDGRY